MPEAITLRQWTDVVRRARLGSTQKVVAMMLANYADADGSRVYPGIARLVFECELTYSTIKTALRKLRQAGLIEKVGRRGDADEYRLILHEDLLERVSVPTPAAVTVELGRIRGHYRGSYRPILRSGKQTAEIDDGAELRSGKQTAEGPLAEESAVWETDRRDESAVCYTDSLRSGKRTATTHYRDTTTTTHYDEEVSAHVLVPGDPSRDEDRNSPQSNRCEHGNNRRRCVPCRAAKKSVTVPLAEAPVTAPELGPRKCPEHGLKGGRRPDGKAHCTVCRQLEAMSS